MEYREPSDIEIFTWDKGAVIRETSLIAVDANGRILSIGRESQYIQHPDARIFSPLKDGKIADWEESRKMLIWYVSQVWKGHLFKKPKIAVCMVPGATGVEKTAMEEAMYAAGARKVLLTELPREEFTREDASKEYDLIISIGQNFRA